jgi:hypothetical protein
MSHRLPSIRYEIALLLGNLGTVLKLEAGRFYAWMSQNIDAASQKEIKLLFLTIMKEFVEHSEDIYLEPFVLSLLVKLQSLLDSIQDYDLVKPILDTLFHLSAHFPQLFATQFQDIIDLLIGWRLDDNLPDPLAKIISGNYW